MLYRIAGLYGTETLPAQIGGTIEPNPIFFLTFVCTKPKPMDNYIVSARKYRPSTFDSVVGQSSLTTTLKNAIAAGKLAHAYLFCGPRGVGKTTCARIFAKTINCLSPNERGEACGTCESCTAFNEGRSYNIHELDAASNNSVEDVRSLIEQVRIPPQVGRYKVFIIDEVHMLSAAAFNAFLKTLEEPPAHAIFILATTEKHKILPTILSRCQIYDFNRMEVADIVGHLRRVAEAEGITYEEEALGVIAQKADGGMRDALSIFDQVASFANGNITYAKVIEDLNVLDYDYYFRLTDSLLKTDIPAAILTLDEILSKGFEANHFIGGLASHFRDLLVSRDAVTLPLLEVADSVRSRYEEQARRCRPAFLYRALKLCNDCDINYRTSNNKRLLVELTLIEVAQAAADDAEACGRGPAKKLKPIFNLAVAPMVKPAAPAAKELPEAGNHVRTQTPQTATVQVQKSTNANAAPRQPEKPRTTVKAPHTISIRLDRQQKTEETPAEKQEPDVITEEKDFDKNALYYQWHRYAALLPREQSAVAGRMKNMEPIIGENWQIDVPVENAQVIGYMETLRDDLLQHLRTQLHNGKITLNFRLIERKEQKRAYGRKEQFAVMLKKSAELRELTEIFGLELA